MACELTPAINRAEREVIDDIITDNSGRNLTRQQFESAVNAKMGTKTPQDKLSGMWTKYRAQQNRLHDFFNSRRPHSDKRMPWSDTIGRSMGRVYADVLLPMRNILESNGFMRTNRFLHDMEAYSHKLSHDMAVKSKPFAEHMDKVKKNKEVWDDLIDTYLTRPEDFQAAYIKSGGKQEDLDAINGVMKDLRKLAEDQGMKFDSAMEDFYMPRSLIRKHMDDFKTQLGEATDSKLDEINAYVDEAKRIAESKGLMFTELAKAKAVEDYFVARASKGKSGSRQARTVNSGLIAARELHNYYKPPDEAFAEYISSMSRDIATHRMFNKAAGVKSSDLISAEDGIRLMMEQDVKRQGGKKDRAVASEADINRVQRMLRDYFSTGRESVPEIFQTWQNANMSLMMGSLRSVMRQIPEIANFTVAAGYDNVFKSILSRLFDKYQIPFDIENGFQSMGLDLHDVIDMSKNKTMSGRVANAIMFPMGQVDKWGSHVLYRATTRQINKALNGSRDGISKLTRRRLETMFDEAELQQMTRDFNEGKATEDVVSAILFLMSDSKPYTKLDRPPMYHKHPTLRVAYMVKTYAMKKQAVFKQQIIDEFARGNWQYALPALGRYMVGFAAIDAMFMATYDRFLKPVDDPDKDTVESQFAKDVINGTIDNIWTTQVALPGGIMPEVTGDGVRWGMGWLPGSSQKQVDFDEMFEKGFAWRDMDKSFMGHLIPHVDVLSKGGRDITRSLKTSREQGIGTGLTQAPLAPDSELVKSVPYIRDLLDALDSASQRTGIGSTRQERRDLVTKGNRPKKKKVQRRRRSRD